MGERLCATGAPMSAHSRIPGKSKCDGVRRERGPACHTGIVRIENGCAIRRQRVDQLSFGQRHPFNAVEEFRMSVAYVSHNPYVRASNFRQRANLSGVVHAQLQHGDAAVLGQPQNRERHADVIVQISHRLSDRKAGGEQMRDGVLDRRLASAARHADLPPAGGQSFGLSGA